jgi:predicted negative regulator of RcsB-dependent stress response
LALDTTDEEQVEALKNWWKDNGTSLLAGVVVVLAVMFGFRKWQDSQSVTMGEASDLYQQIADLSVANLGKAVTDDDLLAAQNLYSQLKGQYSSLRRWRWLNSMLRRASLTRLLQSCSGCSTTNRLAS